MSSLVDRLWYGGGRPLRWLMPLSWLYQAVAEARRRKAWTERHQSLPVPVVVVGNITAGGTGKSPLTARLVAAMVAAGWRPVILSRGYRGRSREYPLRVTGDSDPALAGDEPVMLAQATGVPVVVDPKRSRAAAHALSQSLGDVLICDDGLQHYALPRDIELAVFDASRGLGNGALIPVGPLREPVSRLTGVDFVLVNGADGDRDGRLAAFAGIEHLGLFAMGLRATTLVHLRTGRRAPLSELRGRPVHALAGIGNPRRFFDMLRSLGAELRATAFPDHHRFSQADLASRAGEWLVMTAKDAVKCRGFAPDNAWYLAVEAEVPDAFLDAFLAQLDASARQFNECKTHENGPWIRS